MRVSVDGAPAGKTHMSPGGAGKRVGVSTESASSYRPFQFADLQTTGASSFLTPSLLVHPCSCPPLPSPNFRLARCPNLTFLRFGWADDDGASWGSGDALGTISLRVVLVQAVAKKARFRPTSFAGVGAVHERSKKAGAHCVS